MADDTVSSDMTFVSVDQLATVGSPAPQAEDEMPEPTYTGSIDAYLAGRPFDGDDLLPTLSDANNYVQENESPITNKDDQSAFMWGLGGTTSAPITIGAHSDQDEVDPDVCGEFDTPSSNRHPSPTIHVDERNRESSAKQSPTSANDGNPSVFGYDPNSVDGILMTPAKNAVRTAGDGINTYEVENPFNSFTSNSEAVVVYSEDGPLSSEEKKALASLGKDNNSPSARIVRRLLETIRFQNGEINHLKNAEVELADKIINANTRRYSEVEKERSVAIKTLVEEIDEQRRVSLEVQDENDRLKNQVEELQMVKRDVIEYYKQIDVDFTLSAGVFEALDAVSGNFMGAQKESEETIEKQQECLDEYANRLDEMGTTLSNNRKRCAQLQAENEELRNHIADIEFEQEHAPQPSPKRATSPVRTVDQQVQELKADLDEQEQEVKTLTTLLEKSKDDQKRVNDAFLALNVDLEDARSKLSILIKQRDSAESKCKELTREAALNKEKYFKFSNEMSQNLVNVVNELDGKDSDLRNARRELSAREKAYSSLSITVKQLESQLESVTASVLNKNRNGGARTKSSEKDEVIETIIDSLRHDVSQAQSILKQRTEECNKLQSELNSKEESLINLKAEYSKLQTAASVRRMSNIGQRSIPTQFEEQQSLFLRRLSTKLGCNGESNQEMVTKLSERIEALVGERSSLEETANELRRELKSRENALHCVRSEMQAEISSLKAEVAYLENLKRRAQDERTSAETRLLAVLNEKDVTSHESVGDITSSSIGQRGWSIGDPSEVGSRRGSIFSLGAGDETVHWNDPAIEAAVKSVCALIGTKDELASRNRELRERLENLLSILQSGDTEDAANVTRSLIIQSKDFQEELSRVVGMQQDIIEKVVTQSGAVEPGDETLAYINEDLSPAKVADNKGRVTIASLLHHDEGSSQHLRGRPEIGEAAGFLSDQLAETRALYNEKLKANVQLCGVVNELEQELASTKAAKQEVGKALTQFQDAHQQFIASLAAITGSEVSMVAIEDRVRSKYLAFGRLQSEFSLNRESMRSFKDKATRLLAQKRFLAHIIDIYQTKYRLDVFVRPNGEQRSLKSRLRSRVMALIALNRMCSVKSDTTNSARLVLDVQDSYNIPSMAPIAKRRANVHSLVSATVSIVAVPKLEAAITEKESENVKLRSSVESLNRALKRSHPQGSESQLDVQTSFNYQDDLIDRKNDMSRRLRKLINDNEKLESSLSKEKLHRVASEAKITRYHEKVANLKRKLSKASSNAESKERTYKAAIRYLKSKADKALEVNVHMDENVDPLPQIPSAKEKIDRKEHRETRSALEIQLADAERRLEEVESDSEAYEELSRFVRGLRRAIKRLERPSVSNSRPPPYEDPKKVTA